MDGVVVSQVVQGLGVVGILAVLLWQLILRSPGKGNGKSGAHQAVAPQLALNELMHAISAQTERLHDLGESLHGLSAYLRAALAQASAEHAETVRVLQAIQMAITSGPRRGLP